MNFKYQLSKIKREIEYYIFSNLLGLNDRSGLAIIGCGRSGTTYTSKMFSSFGIDIGHERLKKDGISSWYLVSDQTQVPLGPNYFQIKKLKIKIVHQIRDPIKSISSMQSMGKPSWNFLANEIPIELNEDSKIVKAMKYWYYWNIKAEKKSDFSYRIENIEEVLSRLMDIGGFSVRNFDKMKKIDKKTNTRKHTDLNWNDLEKEDYELTQKIKNLSINYGYKI